MTLKSRIRGGLHRLGIDARRVENAIGREPFEDMRKLCAPGLGVTIVDAGANVGQTIERFRLAFDRPEIHSFEPSPATFKELERRTSGLQGVRLNNRGLGASAGQLELIENSTSLMSSFLEPGPEYWGEVERRVPVPVTTLDKYCAEQSIERLDILKTDTQGYDLEVLRGSAELLDRHRVRLIYMEISYADVYESGPSLDEVYAFLRGRGFFLVSFYNFAFKNGRASWSDALFVDPDYAACLR